jgi:hypothetical protein
MLTEDSVPVSDGQGQFPEHVMAVLTPTAYARIISASFPSLELTVFQVDIVSFGSVLRSQQLPNITGM